MGWLIQAPMITKPTPLRSVTKEASRSAVRLFPVVRRTLMNLTKLISTYVVVSLVQCDLTAEP